jgi:hypothetical protein
MADSRNKSRSFFAYSPEAAPPPLFAFSITKNGMLRKRLEREHQTVLELTQLGEGERIPADD